MNTCHLHPPYAAPPLCLLCIQGKRETAERNAAAFLAQNTDAAATLTTHDVKPYAEHHAGGLIVLGSATEDGARYVKMHDTWGPGRPEEAGDHRRARVPQRTQFVRTGHVVGDPARGRDH